MRIALFTDTYVPQTNGVSLTLQRLVRHMQKRNIETRLFVPNYADNQKQTLEQNLQAIASFPFRMYPECRIALPNYFTIRRQLQAFKPDLIHIATPFNIGLSGLLYARKYGIPHVASYHTHFDQYLEYYNLQFLSTPLWNYMKWFHQSCDSILVPSSEVQTKLQEKGFQNVEIWSRGVDCNLFHPNQTIANVREQYGIKEQYILLYAGRLAPEKDLDVLLETMEWIPPEIREKVHWLIVGEGPYRKEMEKRTVGSVTFTGWKSDKELAVLYAAADLFVFPSSTETFGNVVLEAMASALPIVAADAGGVKELVVHEGNGLLFPPRSGVDMKQAIVDLLNQPQHRVEYAKESRKLAISRSWNSTLDHLVNQYEKLADKNSSVMIYNERVKC